MEEQLLKIFEGNSELFITTSSTGEVDERGKVQVETYTVHEPVTLKLWKDHLEGKQRIGIKPEKDDVCKWGCICLLYTSPSPRDRTRSRMPSSA